MNLHPRIDSISSALDIEYMAATKIEFDAFEMLLDEIERGIAMYREHWRK